LNFRADFLFVFITKAIRPVIFMMKSILYPPPV